MLRKTVRWNPLTAFTDFIFQINDINTIPNPDFALFHTASQMQADCIVDSHFVPELRLPDQDPVYISDSGIHVYLHDEKESRYLCDYFTGKVKMRFRDDGEKKHLELANNPRLVPITELKLLNILGMEKTMSEHGKFILHASFIGTDQGALLFTAPSGTGKSTQAALWAQFRKAEIINGDRTGLWKGPDGFLAGIR